MYRGSPADTAFTKSLLRFRAGSGVHPEWALLVFLHHLHAGRFLRESRITTSIAHLTEVRFRTIEFPIPPEAEQDSLVQRTRECLDEIERVQIVIAAQETRARALRRSVLASAFSGKLVVQDLTDESASVLLDRIAPERASSNAHKPTRTRKPRTRVTA
jgi:type I restriction enzyme S subunit